MNRTGIQWPFLPEPLLTVNPFIGCSKASEGCEHCYAEAMAVRIANFGQTASEDYQRVITHDDDPSWNGRTVFLPRVLAQVRKRRKPATVFWCSMSDMFHESNAPANIEEVWYCISQTPHLTHVVLTKRPARMAEFFTRWSPGYAAHLQPNLWLGVTAENQQRANERIPILLDIRGEHKTFVSVEPMLGPVDLADYISLNRKALHGGGYTDALDCVVCGGESGPNARPMHPGWVRSLRDQCAAAGTAFWFKQWGEYIPQEQPSAIPLLTAKAASEALYVDRDGNTAPARIGARSDRVTVQRLGTRSTGHLLDGVEHRESVR